MMYFRELYKKLNHAKDKDFFGALKDERSPFYNPLALDCLLNPQKHLNKIKDEKKTMCFDVDESNTLSLCDNSGITPVRQAALDRINASPDSLAALKTVRSPELAFALIAPAFLGQFEGVQSAGVLRSALKALGFDGVIEVALFADILTLKEAIEFDRNIISESDFQITSCCCPMWLAMIKKIYNELIPHMPASVSPMIASGRVIKLLYPNAKTVFIGPCLAKKSEAKEPGINDAINHVLTFSELKDIFAAVNIDASKYENNEKEHSSRSGRIYARKKGVSDAIARTIRRINPQRTIMPVSKTADGVPACKLMISELIEGKQKGNFFEGMGCAGGCVGGPKVCTNVETGTANVNTYAEAAPYDTPIDNPYIIELLHRIGIDTDDDLLSSEIFSRKL